MKVQIFACLNRISKFLSICFANRIYTLATQLISINSSWERKTLDLHDGARDYRGTRKDILPTFDCRLESRIHICHEEYLINYVVHRCYHP
jgi:hypothetical protein